MIRKYFSKRYDTVKKTSRFPFLFLVCACLISLGNYAWAKNDDMEFISDFVSPVPHFGDFKLKPEDVALLVTDKQLILTHPLREIQAPGKKGLQNFTEVMFVTSLMQIDSPIETVRKVVMDFSSYNQFVPNTKQANILKQNDQQTLIETRVEIDTPIGQLKEDLILQYTREQNGDITILLRQGAVDASLARWEFFDLGNGKTLAAYTSWTDLGSTNFIIKAVLRSDPDLKKAAPIALGAVVIEEFKKRVEGKAPRPKREDMPAQPVMPTFAHGKDIPLETLARLSKLGSLLFVHMAQWVNHPKEGEMEFIYVTAGSMIHAPTDYVISQSIQFDRYKEFFHHVRDNKIHSASENLRENPFDVDWNLRVGLGVMKIGIDYNLQYQWMDEHVLRFDRTSGDVGHVNGVWEYIAVDETNTLMVITAVSKVGKEGSLILKLSNKIPNLEMISTIIAQALIVEKQKPWIEDQYSKDNSKE